MVCIYKISGEAEKPTRPIYISPLLCTNIDDESGGGGTGSVTQKKGPRGGGGYTNPIPAAEAPPATDDQKDIELLYPSG